MTEHVDPGERAPDWVLPPHLNDVDPVFDPVQAPKSPYAEFTLAVVDDGPPRSYVLKSGIYVLGRDALNPIRVINRYVSRRHAYLVRVSKANRHGATYCLVDGNRKGKSSRNGVFVNGQRVATRYLRSGDEINLGPEVKAYFFVITPIATTTLHSFAPSSNGTPQALGTHA